MKTYSYAVILLLSFVFPAYAQQVYSCLHGSADDIQASLVY